MAAAGCTAKCGAFTRPSWRREIVWRERRGKSIRVAEEAVRRCAAKSHGGQSKVSRRGRVEIKGGVVGNGGIFEKRESFSIEREV